MGNPSGSSGLSDSLRRFNLAVQRTRVIVYAAAVPIGLGAGWAGIVHVEVAAGLAVVALALVSSLVFFSLYRRGVERVAGVDLHWYWSLLDVGLISIGVHLTGGVDSAWWVWYLTIWGALAFVAGRNAALGVAAISAIAYVGSFFVVGQVTGIDKTLYVPVFRMLFLFWASFYFLVGLTRLRERRLTIERQVTELKRLTGELEQRTRQLAVANRRIVEADRMKSRFLANMSHELRTPMNSIIGFAEILVERLEGKIDKKHLDFQNHILSSGQHLLSIINDILDLSKIEAGRMGIYPERFPVGMVVEGICGVMKGQALRYGINFKVDIPAELPEMEADLAKFKQVVFNLISNAVKFSPPESDVEVRVRLEQGGDGDLIVVSVADHGPGIPPAERELVFEEFHQTQAGRRAEGTGLGLALVKRFVELQGGTVTLSSEVGVGTTFSVALPVVYRGPRGERDAARELDADMQPGERVLVVEDDDEAYRMISRDLESAGYIPVRAKHADEAIHLAHVVRPVAITLDLVLPGADGWEVLKAIKGDETTGSIPVVIVSFMDNRELGIALGADDYFLKPFDRSKLLDRLRQLTMVSEREIRPRLLLIDDDTPLQEVLRDELEAQGYEVDVAPDGQQGVRIATERLPDVIVLDLVMPGLNGFEVVDELRKHAATERIPIVVFTAKELDDEDRAMLQNRIATVVRKDPRARSRLVSVIRDLERRQAIEGVGKLTG